MLSQKVLRAQKVFHRCITTSAPALYPFSAVDFPKVRIQNATPDKDKLKINWEDGHQSHFPYVWLRDCAPPAGQTLPSGRLGFDGRPLPNIRDIDLDVSPEKVEVLPRGNGVLIEWPPYHEVSYSSDWLRYNCERSGLKRHLSDRFLWGSAEMQALGGMPSVVAGNKSIELLQFELLQNMDTYGIVHIPDAFGHESAIHAALGLTQPHLVASYSAKCFTKYANGLHTGVPFVNPIPNLCILKFPQRKMSAGVFQFVDGFKAAKTLQQKDPFVYQYLCSTAVNWWASDRRYMDQLSSVDSNSSPVFVEGPTKLEKIVFNDTCRSMEQDVKPENMKHFYYALKSFNKVCYDKTHLVEHQPKPHDMVILDNTRVLHGATAFSSESSDTFVEERFYHWNRSE